MPIRSGIALPGSGKPCLARRRIRDRSVLRKRLSKLYSRRSPHRNLTNMQQKTALITGANRGLGFEAARLFLENGYLVVFAGRSLGALEEARRQLDPEGTRTSTIELNMTSPDLIQGVPGQLEAAGIQLHVLVNNAGVFPRDGDPVDGLRNTLETNVTGAVALTLALSSHLLNAPEPRVVMVSSGLGSFGRCAGEGAPLSESNYLAYQTSKAALNMATVCLSKQFAGTLLLITAISPGWCRTDMGGVEAPRSAREGAEVIFRAATLPAGTPGGTFIGEDGPLPW
jgi:NAD(P)-dependent dehydrogenase (short-subunit alcohol dehydrogenase family)